MPEVELPFGGTVTACASALLSSDSVVVSADAMGTVALVHCTPDAGGVYRQASVVSSVSLADQAITAVDIDAVGRRVVVVGEGGFAHVLQLDMSVEQSFQLGTRWAYGSTCLVLLFLAFFLKLLTFVWSVSRVALLTVLAVWEALWSDAPPRI